MPTRTRASRPRATSASIASSTARARPSRCAPISRRWPRASSRRASARSRAPSRSSTGATSCATRRRASADRGSSRRLEPNGTGTRASTPTRRCSSCASPRSRTFRPSGSASRSATPASSRCCSSRPRPRSRSGDGARLASALAEVRRRRVSALEALLVAGGAAAPAARELGAGLLTGFDPSSPLFAAPALARQAEELRRAAAAARAARPGASVVVDVAATPDAPYYTGLSFAVDAAGAAGIVAAGGRYDTLLARFGTPAPALGFCIGLEALASASSASAAAAARPLRIAVGKGRLLAKTLAALREGGAAFGEPDGRRLLVPSADGAFELLLLKDDDVPTYVAHGGADLGVVGSDRVAESGEDVFTPVDLPFGECRLSLIGRAGEDVQAERAARPRRDEVPPSRGALLRLPQDRARDRPARRVRRARGRAAPHGRRRRPHRDGFDDRRERPRGNRDDRDEPRHGHPRPYGSRLAPRRDRGVPRAAAREGGRVVMRIVDTRTRAGSARTGRPPRLETGRSRLRHARSRCSRSSRTFCEEGSPRSGSTSSASMRCRLARGKGPKRTEEKISLKGEEGKKASRDEAVRPRPQATRLLFTLLRRSSSRSRKQASLTRMRTGPKQKSPPNSTARSARRARRIEAYHRRQIPTGFAFTDRLGVSFEERPVPLDSVGVYVPGGRAFYPSSLLMGVVPARVGGRAAHRRRDPSARVGAQPRAPLGRGGPRRRRRPPRGRRPRRRGPRLRREGREDRRAGRTASSPRRSISSRASSRSTCPPGPRRSRSSRRPTPTRRSSRRTSSRRPSTTPTRSASSLRTRRGWPKPCRKRRTRSSSRSKRTVLRR